MSEADGPPVPAPAVVSGDQETDSEQTPKPSAWRPLPPEFDFLGPLPPRMLRPVFAYPQVLVFGRTWPKAPVIERMFWGLGLVCCLICIYLSAIVLTPDPEGIGTHTQLGLPACGFVEQFGGPCPSCGYTTTYTLAAHFRPIDAIVNQPFGFFLFLVTLASIPATAFCVFRGVSLFAITESWPWPRIFGTLLILWLAAWGYKWVILSG